MMGSMKRVAVLYLLVSLALAQPWCVVQSGTTQAIQAAIDSCSAKGGGTA
jgi:polygalacturonase